MDKIIAKILPRILGAASPALKNMICEFTKKFQESAAKTENPIDDILADFLNAFLCE